MGHQVVVQRGKLRVCGMVTAGAGVVFVPADIKAGRGFGGVGHQIVIQRGKLRVCGMVTAGTGVVFIPADIKAGRGFGGVGHQIVVQRGKLCIIGGIVTAGTGVVFIPALFGTGRSFRVAMYHVMVIGIDFAFFLIAQCAGGFCNAGRLAEFVRTARTKFHLTKTANRLILAGGRSTTAAGPMVFPHCRAAFVACHSMLRRSSVL